MNETGLIFNIQKFSVHDGPGIRTTVFLKGCPLSCAWCSNPESQRFTPELMIRDINCRTCGACVKACSKGAISISIKKGRIIDRKKCDSCLACVDACMYDSLLRCGIFMSAQEVLDEVLQDQVFYKNSGGGVTLSGGEPLSQPEFCSKLLKTCKKEGLHTALETAGIAPWEDMVEVLAYADLILFDVKHLDSEAHRKACGAGNKQILENLRKAAKITDVWIRVPLINKFNDSEEHIRQIAKLSIETGAKKISLLPYHEGGKTKVKQLEKPYAYPQGKPPGKKHIKKLEQIIEKAGVTVTVGN